MINPVVYRFIKQAVASNDDILLAASRYYDNDDPEDPKRRWDHVLDDIEVAKKIRGRDLTPVELGTLAFHDSGYKNPKGYMWGLKNHPKLSRKIFKKEAPGLGFNDDEIKHMAKVIAYHMRTPKKGSPLLKDDLQMLMFGADEGTPKEPVEDARKYFMKAVAGRYPEVPDKTHPDFIKKLVERVRTFHDYTDAPGLEYYHRVYPNYHRDLYNYWHSDQIIDDYKKMLVDELAGKSLKQTADDNWSARTPLEDAKLKKKKIVKKASKLYTYVPKNNTVDIDGLLSTSLTEDGWKKYSKRTGKGTKEEVLKALDAWEPEWSRSKAVSALAQPIPDDAAEDLRRFADESELYSFNVDDLTKSKLLKNLRKTHKGPGTYAVDSISEDKINWKRKPKKLTFYGIPHYMVETTEGKIPANLVKHELKTIGFPESELASLTGKNKIYTTRVSKDYNKYKLGDTVKSPWGDKYTIDSEDIYDDIKKHKFYDELTEEQKKELKKYKRMKLLGLSKKASKLYTYVDPEADLSKGILSIRNVPEEFALRRYGSHVKDPKNLNKDYIIEQLDLHDPHRPDYIYALDAPVPNNANPGLLKFRDEHKLVSWDPAKVKDLVKIVRRYNNRRREEVSADFEPLKHMQWGRLPNDRTRFKYAPVYKVLTESGKIPPELLTMEDQDKYTIHGAILGCLGDHAKDFKYNITEDLPNDPWKAIINTGPVDSVTLRKFHKYHNVDVDKAGVPYYFLTKNDRTGDKAVWYSDEFGPIPINTKKQKEKAKQIGLDKGLKEDQLDFKFQ